MATRRARLIRFGHGQQCVGVLQVITAWDDGAYNSTSLGGLTVEPADSVTASLGRDEYADRLARVRTAMREFDLAALLLTSPENIYYMIGLNHQGHFAFTMLLLASEGQPILITRSMERVVIDAQTLGIDFLGYGDDEEPGATVIHAVKLAGCGGERIGVNPSSMFFPPGIWTEMRLQLPRVEWVDTSRSSESDPTFQLGLVDQIRLVKSVAEIKFLRRSAAISDASAAAGLKTAGVGVNEIEVAAAIYQTMVSKGGEYPGFAPFVRSSETLQQEHTTWRDHHLESGEQLFLELSGSYARYHAPLGRTAFLESAPKGVERVRSVAIDAIEAARSAVRPGVYSGDVYKAWQAAVDNGLGHSRLRRHHCGYSVGIGFPPSWTGGGSVLGLRPNGKVPIKSGMVFHLWAWINDERLGEYLLSDSALVTEAGTELLTKTERPMVIG